MNDKNTEKKNEFKLVVNKIENDWPTQFIAGADILVLAKSPSNWVVNQIVPGPGEDPEIGAGQQVDLDQKAEPHGIKKFQTRKPATNPG